MASTDPDRLPERLSPESRARRRKKRSRLQAEFVRGPIRVDWLCRLARLPASAMATGLTILFRAGALRTTKDIPLTPTQLDRFGVGRRTSYRALQRLEDAGLVKVKRHPGRCARVTLLRAFAEGRKRSSEN